MTSRREFLQATSLAAALGAAGRAAQLKTLGVQLYTVRTVLPQKPEETLNVIQKVLRIDDRKVARETYEDEMRRYNPGGGFEQSNMKKVIDRARDTRKMERKVEIQEVFDLSMAAELDAGLKKTGWKP